MVTLDPMGHQVSISREIALLFLDGLSGDADSNLSSLILDAEHQYHAISLFLFYEYSSDVLDKGTKIVAGIVYDGRSLLGWGLVMVFVEILGLLQRRKVSFELHDGTC